MKMTAEWFRSLAPGRSRVGLRPARLRHKRPVLVASLPPAGPSVPRCPFPGWSCALRRAGSVPSLQTGTSASWTPALGREDGDSAPPPPGTFDTTATGPGWSFAQHSASTEAVSRDSWALGELDKGAGRTR